MHKVLCLCPFALRNNSFIHYVQLPAPMQPPSILLSPASWGGGAPAPPALPEAPPLLQLFASNPAPQILLIIGKLLCPKSLGYFKFPALKCAFRMNAFSLENAATLWIMG